MVPSLAALKGRGGEGEGQKRGREEGEKAIISGKEAGGVARL